MIANSFIKFVHFKVVGEFSSKKVGIPMELLFLSEQIDWELNFEKNALIQKLASPIN